jgi:thymidylate synthase (FAD)
MSNLNNILFDKIGRMDLIDSLGTDLTVVNAARVSFLKESTVFEDKDEKLLRYLAKHNHWSPFAHASLQVRIKAPISVQRQWFKHRVGVENNSESTRYVDVKTEFYVPQQLRLQSKDKKQGSDGLLEYFRQIDLLDEVHMLYLEAAEVYRLLIDQGVAKEQARDVLPLATYTTWISTISLAAAHRIYTQRTKDGAQWEIAQYAEALAWLARLKFPKSWAALEGDLI